MKLSDVLRLSLKTLTERKLRAALTIIGVAIGPMALLMIGSIVTGYGDYIVSSISGLGQNLIVVTPRSGYQLTKDDVEYFMNLPGVIDATPFYTTQGEITLGGERKTIYIYGVNPQFVVKAISSLNIREGYAPSETELSRALVGYNIVFNDNGERYYNLGDVLSVTVYKVGERGRVEIKRVNVVVTGILDKFGGAVFLNPDTGIFVPIETLEKTIGIKEWSGVLVLVSSPDLVDNVEKTIRNIYANKVEVISFIAIARTVSNIVAAVDFVTFAATTSSFAVAVAGVAASMITSVMERTREIGVMKAIGFRDKQVLVLILSEGIIISIVGYTIGLILGVIGARFLAGSTNLRIGDFWEITAEPKFTADLIARSVFMTISVGILGALFPAYRAMKIPPAVALKYE
ncbi:MAG: ABC transporter permease [Desulfurococcaceae archaeon]